MRPCEFAGCERRHKGHGLCDGHLWQRKQGKDLTPIMRGRPLSERLIAASSMLSCGGCWLWQGSLEDGYGRLSVNGKLELAHRASFKAFRGQIPEGMLVCHTCDVRNCWNPTHLFLGTDLDNHRDKVAKGRGMRKDPTKCASGQHEWIPSNLRDADKRSATCIPCLSVNKR